MKKKKKNNLYEYIYIQTNKQINNQHTSKKKKFQEAL